MISFLWFLKQISHWLHFISLEISCVREKEVCSIKHKVTWGRKNQDLLCVHRIKYTLHIPYIIQQVSVELLSPRAWARCWEHSPCLEGFAMSWWQERYWQVIKQNVLDRDGGRAKSTWHSALMSDLWRQRKHLWKPSVWAFPTARSSLNLVGIRKVLDGREAQGIFKSRDGQQDNVWLQVEAWQLPTIDNEVQWACEDGHRILPCCLVVLWHWGT